MGGLDGRTHETSVVLGRAMIATRVGELTDCTPFRRARTSRVLTRLEAHIAPARERGGSLTQYRAGRQATFPHTRALRRPLAGNRSCTKPVRGRARATR